MKEDSLSLAAQWVIRRGRRVFAILFDERDARRVLASISLMDQWAEANETTVEQLVDQELEGKDVRFAGDLREVRKLKEKWGLAKRVQSARKGGGNELHRSPHHRS